MEDSVYYMTFYMRFFGLMVYMYFNENFVVVTDVVMNFTVPAESVV